MTKYSEALEALNENHGKTTIISHGVNKGVFNTVLLTNEQRETIRELLQPSSTSAEVEEAIERCQANENYSSDHPTKWAQFRISDIKTLIQATRQPQKDVSVLVQNVKALHSDVRLTAGKYDYQCGFLDALESIKQALKAFGEVV